MAFISAGVEYGLHCILFLVGQDAGAPVPSSRDLAELQGVPADFAAKIFTKLQKAGLLATVEGLRGGIRLARSADRISIHDVVIAIDGDQPLFNCREIRGNCAVFDGQAPAWATSGVCGIHAIMLRAEKAMRDSLRATTLLDLSQGVAGKAPDSYAADVSHWLADRIDNRRSKPSLSDRGSST